MNLKSKFEGALLGTVVGDSLGRNFEGFSPTGIEHVQKALVEISELRYTDDTQMMLAMAESLIECRGFIAEHMARKFVERYDPSRGYGPGCSWVLSRIREGSPWNVPAREVFGGQGSYGNGSAMRIAPIGVLYHNDPENLREIARQSSLITHTHELAVEGAILQATTIAVVTSKDPSHGLSGVEIVEHLMGQARTEVYLRKLEEVRLLLCKNPTSTEIVKKLGNGIEAFNSVPAAIYCSLANPSSFESAILRALSLGGDADTISAMTGAIAGAYHGSDGIPQEWREKIEDGEKISELSGKIYELFLLKKRKM